ncbi:GIY-YIG nuclease family protein [Breoghania sp. L-A4]|uniref:GIY-YIG nuclease family protein n=1 Tax=Breoghania sp. L-A4 TaxID=2304600 RepID=UPI000E35AB5E|nr:GIY-YIG nuclease family protein [Breoghania sp. L-A4]AXS39952.1 GIY-YIG nuclease family protein [Breoghania sp. L-A4]
MSASRDEHCVYILADRTGGNLTIALTGNLSDRITQYRHRARTGFGRRLPARRLVYYEFHDTRDAAAQRVALLKSWDRSWTDKLIEDRNPDWTDLAADVLLAQ